MATVMVVLAVAAAVLAAAVTVLKVVAPMTKTTVDDKALAYAEDAQAVVQKAEDYLAPKDAPAAK